MSQHLVIEVPDELAEGLRNEAIRLGTSAEQVALEYLKVAVSATSAESDSTTHRVYDPIAPLIGQLIVEPDVNVDQIIDDHDKYIAITLDEELNRGQGNIH